MINLKNFTNMPWYNWNSILTNNVVSSRNSAVVLNNFDVIDKKIDVATRTLDFYDVYRFIDSVDSNASYLNKYASMPNNTSLAVVADFKGYDNKDFHVGDIIIKGDKGQEILVKTKQNGIFVPQYFQQNDSSITIKMGIISSLVDLNTWETLTGWQKIDYDQDNQADIPIPNFIGQSVYNIFVNPNDFIGPINFEVDSETGDIIYPIIKFYSSIGEEVSYEGIIYTTTSFTVSCNMYVHAVVR